jgi:hypothetical protein
MVELQPSKLAMRVRFPPPASSSRCARALSTKSRGSDLAGAFAGTTNVISVAGIVLIVIVLVVKRRRRQT